MWSAAFPPVQHREFIDWRFLAYIKSCWYFRPSFVTCTLPCCHSPPPSLVQREGEGMGSHSQVVLESIYCIVGVLHYVSDQIQNLQNCSTTPRQKPRRGGGLKQINSCCKVPFQVTFLWWNFALSSMSLIFLRSAVLISIDEQRTEGKVSSQQKILPPPPSPLSPLPQST